MQSDKRSTLWLLAATAAPIAHYANCGWLTASIAALAVLPLSLLPKSWERLPKSLAAAEIIWLGAVAGFLLRNSAAYWPSDNAFAVPLTILTLAVFTSTAASAGASAVMALCMALLAVPLAISGAANVNLNWLKAEMAPWPVALTLALLLPNLPAGGEKKSGGAIMGAAILAIALSALIQGTISIGVASAVPSAFYQSARTLGYLEPAAAIAMTLGWYAAAVYLLQSAIHLARPADISAKAATVLHTGTSALLLLVSWQPEYPKITVLSTLFWVLIPFFTILKKVKNSA